MKSILRLIKSAVAVLLTAASVHGQVLLVANIGNGTIGSYNAVTGAVINSSFISGLNGPYSITHDSTYLYITSVNAGLVGKYDATTGAAINASFITGLATPTGIVYDAGSLYVADISGAVGKYSATDGSAINASLFSVGGSRQIELFNGNLYVTDYVNERIGVYTTSGATVNASFVSGFSPGDMAFSGGSMFVTNNGGNSIGEYNALTGATINASLVTTGLSSPVGLVINGNGNLAVANIGAQINEYTLAGSGVNTPWITSGIDTPVGLDIIAVPEPTTMALLGVGFGALVFVRRNRLRRQLVIS